MAKATLFDLYKTGRILEIGDGDNSVEVYLQKMNSIQQQKAQRKANAARANVLAMQRDENSEQRAEYEAGFVDQFPTFDDRIEFLIADKMINERPKAEAKISAQEKWTEDGYLEGLQESWYDGAQETWSDPETRDEESERIYSELKIYLDEVEAELTPTKERSRREFESKDATEVHKLVVNRQLKAEADIAWLNEYRMQEILLSTRKSEDHRKFYFDNRQILDHLPNLVVQQLVEAISSLTVDVAEGKESQESQDS